MRTKLTCFERTIELLEDRIAPATVIHAGANLAISNQDGSLLVETTATPGEIKVTDGSGTETFTGITGKITLTGISVGSTSADTISFVADLGPFQGNLIINSGHGNDTVNLSGTINRSVTVNTGLGNDSVVLNGMAVSVGKSFTVNDPGGTTLLFDLNDRNLTVGGAMSISGVTTFDMGLGNSLEVAKALKIIAHPAATMPLTVLLTGTTTTVGGDLAVTFGNGDDTLDLGGTIDGNVILKTGLGNDTITFNRAAEVGKSFTVNDVGGETMLFDMNDRNLTIGGALSLSGVTTFDMGAANALEVAKAVKITAHPTASTALTALFSGTATLVGGDLKITGGFTNDVTSFTSQVSINGNLSIKQGQGDNTIVLTPSAGGSGIGGTFSTNGLDGVDVVVFGADAEIAGKTSILLGNGINTFVDTPTSQYGKDLTISAGFNTSTCVVTGQVAGNLSVTMAPGGAGNTTVFTGSVGAGMKIKYLSGNDGTLEVLTLAPTAAVTLNVDVKFGNGDATFNLGPNVSLTGKVVGRGGTYTFNQGTAILLPSLKLINFPT
jgi:hypothetical protein